MNLIWLYFHWFRHVKEHLDGQVDVEDKEMTDEELEFHYFK